MYIGTIDEMVHENAIFVLKLDRELKLYTHPKEWQSLNDAELFNLSQQCDLNHILGLIDYGRAVEAKLKEKNT